MGRLRPWRLVRVVTQPGLYLSRTIRCDIRFTSGGKIVFIIRPEPVWGQISGSFRFHRSPDGCATAVNGINYLPDEQKTASPLIKIILIKYLFQKVIDFKNGSIYSNSQYHIRGE
jgi:hypothetical protein